VAAVVELINTPYPRATWATKMDRLTRIATGKAAGEVGRGLAEGLATLPRWTRRWSGAPRCGRRGES